MPPLLYQLGGLVLLVGGGLGVWKAALTLRRYRRLRSVDEIGVRDLTRGSGPVVVSGRARPADEVLEAPRTGEECLAYEYRIEKASRTPTLSNMWETEHERRGDVPFLLEDDGGSVLVVPAGAELRLAEHGAGSTHEDDGRLMGRGGDRKFHEARLDAGETVTVYAGPVDGADTDWGDVGVVLGDGDDVPEALVADGRPDELRSGVARQAAKLAAIAVAAFAVGLPLVGVV